MNRILTFFMRPERKEDPMSLNQIEELAIGEITHEARAILDGVEHLKTQLAAALAHNKILIASEAAARAELAKFKAEAADSLTALKTALGFEEDHALAGLADHPDDIKGNDTLTGDAQSSGAGNDAPNAPITGSDIVINLGNDTVTGSASALTDILAVPEADVTLVAGPAIAAPTPAPEITGAAAG